MSISRTKMLQVSKCLIGLAVMVLQSFRFKVLAFFRKMHFSPIFPIIPSNNIGIITYSHY